MKATGIVKPVEDLVRIAIPPKIKMALRIREGSSLHTI